MLSPLALTDLLWLVALFLVSPILIKKLHEFIVEADVTVEEWRKFLTHAGTEGTEGLLLNSYL